MPPSLELCNLDRLWTNPALTQKAKVISPNSQDYVCLLNQDHNNAQLTWGYNNNCTEDIGSIRILQPEPTGEYANTLNITPSVDVNIGKLTAVPGTEVTINGFKKYSINMPLVNCGKYTASNTANIYCFELITNNGMVFTTCTGTIRYASTATNADECRFTDSFFLSSSIFGGNINISNSSFESSKIHSRGSLEIIHNVKNTYSNSLVSGVNIEYTGPGIGKATNLEFIAQRYLSIKNVDYINAKISSANYPTKLYVNMENIRQIINSTFSNIENIKITTREIVSNPPAPPASIGQKIEAVKGINIEGTEFTDLDTYEEYKVVSLGAGSYLKANIVQVSNFINYGTIYATGQAILSNGINYGDIYAPAINQSNFYNSGTITYI